MLAFVQYVEASPKYNMQPTSLKELLYGVHACAPLDVIMQLVFDLEVGMNPL